MLNPARPTVQEAGPEDVDKQIVNKVEFMENGMPPHVAHGVRHRFRL